MAERIERRDEKLKAPPSAMLKVALAGLMSFFGAGVAHVVHDANRDPQEKMETRGKEYAEELIQLLQKKFDALIAAGRNKEAISPDVREYVITAAHRDLFSRYVRVQTNRLIPDYHAPADSYTPKAFADRWKEQKQDAEDLTKNSHAILSAYLDQALVLKKQGDLPQVKRIGMRDTRSVPYDIHDPWKTIPTAEHIANP